MEGKIGKTSSGQGIEGKVRTTQWATNGKVNRVLGKEGKGRLGRYKRRDGKSSIKCFMFLQRVVAGCEKCNKPADATTKPASCLPSLSPSHLWCLPSCLPLGLGTSPPSPCKVCSVYFRLMYFCLSLKTLHLFIIPRASFTRAKFWLGVLRVGVRKCFALIR